jgi:hypothetical protein
VKKPALLLLLVLAAACHGSSPTDPTGGLAVGTLTGAVTIGPNCPAENPNDPCPTPPAAYAARKVLVLDSAGTRLLFTVDIDGHGLYLIDLAAGQYTVDLRKSGLDRSSDVPRKVTITRGGSTRVDISIDTGIR